jgi:hypothetical protein
MTRLLDTLGPGAFAAEVAQSQGTSLQATRKSLCQLGWSASLDILGKLPMAARGAGGLHKGREAAALSSNRATSCRQLGFRQLTVA